MNSRIVIGDVHGCFKTLKALVEKLPAGVPITFVGDLIDRGPDSKSVVDFVIDNGHDCVLANHEQMMIEESRVDSDENGEYIFYQSYHNGIWIMNGGQETLKSYDNNVQVFKKHLDWMKKLPVYLEYPEIKNEHGQSLLVSHSTAATGFNEHKISGNEEAFKDCLLWERTPNPDPIDGKFNVFGHTPQRNKPDIKNHYANIDTGVCFKRGDYGRLTALQFPEMVVYSQENIE